MFVAVFADGEGAVGLRYSNEFEYDYVSPDGRWVFLWEFPHLRARPPHICQV